MLSPRRLRGSLVGRSSRSLDGVVCAVISEVAEVEDTTDAIKFHRALSYCPKGPAAVARSVLALYACQREFSKTEVAGDSSRACPVLLICFVRAVVVVVCDRVAVAVVVGVGPVLLAVAK